MSYEDEFQTADAVQAPCPVKLREPEEIIVPQIIDVLEPDLCCGKPLTKLLCNGVLAHLSSWECPKCCTTWKPTLVNDTLRHWKPEPMIAVFR